MLVYHTAFLLLVVGTTAFFAAIAALNVRHADRTVRERTEWLADTIEVEDPNRLLDYHRLTTASSQLQSIVVTGIVLLALYTGLFGAATEFVFDAVASDLLAGVTLVVVSVLAMRLVSLPFDAFDTFGVEEAFDFNEQSPALFVRDTVVSAAFTAVLVAVLAGIVLYVVQALPDLWWIVAAGLAGVFLLGAQVIFPRVFLPLFYDFEPVENSDLRDAVEDVFERAGFTCDQVYVMDASSRSGHSNAFFTGFGRTKRVVLFDTLVEQMDEREIQSVLAHELAHWKENHVWAGIAVSTLRIGVLLFVAQFLIDATWLYAMFDVPKQEAAGLLLAALWVSPITEFTAPLTNKLWLANEREADDFARDVMGDGDALADALADLTSENLGNPFPHPLYETFHHRHPPVPERIRSLTQGDSGGGSESPAS